jgi:hypothetical protein
MKTFNKLFDKQPNFLNIYYDTLKKKLVIFESRCIDNGSFFSDDFPQNESLNYVFTLTPYLMGMLKSLNLPFYKVKRCVLSAINKDLSKGNMFDKSSNLYNLLVNEFGIKLKALSMLGKS